MLPRGCKGSPPRTALRTFFEVVTILLLVATGLFLAVAPPVEAFPPRLWLLQAERDQAQEARPACEFLREQKATAPQPTSPSLRPKPAEPSKRIYFVPIGQFPSSWLQLLVAHYSLRCALEIGILPEIRLDKETLWRVIDRSRGQLIGEELIALMIREYPGLAADHRAILIGMVQGDMYARSRIGPEWDWALAVREEYGFAVIATLRMNQPSRYRPGDPNLFYNRLWKMVSKQIGALYYRLPESSDLRSVMFGPILTLELLDVSGDDYF